MQGWETPDRGVLFVVSGASGTGKSTLLSKVFEKLPGLEFSVSATTRTPRAGEVHGKDYWFVDRANFIEMRDSGQLLEHAEVYSNLYGTPRLPVEEALKEGRSIVLDIDVQGAAQVRNSFAKAVSVFILPPSTDALRQRLIDRGKDSPETIERRMQQAGIQLKGCGSYDYLVMNTSLETAVISLQSIFIAEMLRREHRERWVHQTLVQLG